MADMPEIKENERLSDILKAIPRKAQKGFFKVPLQWTCMDATPEFIAVGTDAGLVYLCNRETHQIQKLTCSVKDQVVSSVKMINSVDYLVAVGTTAGLVFMFQLPSILPGRNKELLIYAVKDQHHASITCLEWSQNGMKLFSGDKVGMVCCTEMNFSEHKSKSYVVIEEPHDIVQLSYAHMHLLISTRFRSFLCNMTNNPMNTVQIGTKDRKSFGNYGAVFLPGVALARDAVLFASRPGLRLWRANLQGTVQATYIFKELLTDVSQGILLLRDTKAIEGVAAGMENENCCFGPLMIFEDTLMVSFQGSSLFVMDPGLGTFVGYHTSLGQIQNVAVCGEEIYIMRSNQQPQVLCLSRIHPVLPPRSSETGSQRTEVKALRSTIMGPTDDSPAQRLSETANRMSESIRGAFKGVGEKMQVIQEGEKNPPWGLAAKKSDQQTTPGSESDSVDSAKEASPSNIPSPASEPDLVSKSGLPAPGKREENPPGAPPLVRLDQDSLTAIEILPGTSTCNFVDPSKSTDSSPSVNRDKTSRNKENKRSIDRFDSIVADTRESDIVIFTKQKKRKKKKASKDKDSISNASEDSLETSFEAKSDSLRLGPEADQDNSLLRARVERARSLSPALKTRAMSDPYSPAVQRERSYSPRPHIIKGLSHSSREDLQTPPPTQKTAPQLSSSRPNSKGESMSSGVENETKAKKIFPANTTEKKSKTSTLEETKEAPISKNVYPTDKMESISTVIPGTTKIIKTLPKSIQTPKSMQSSASDFMQTHDQQSGKTLHEVTAMGLPVSQVYKTSHSSGNGYNSKVEIGKKRAESSKSPETHSEKATPMSDSSVEDFYSQFKGQSYGSPSEEITPANISNEQSIQDAVKSMSLTDQNKNPKTVPKVQGGTNKAALLADIWSDFPAPGYLSDMCVTDKLVWCCDKTESLYYSSLTGPGLNWKKVPKAGATQIALSASGWLFWRLCKNTVFAATNVTTRNPYGTKWMEIVRDVASISVDETVAWYAKTSGEVVMQKNLSKDRPSYRPVKVKSLGQMKISQIKCKRRVVWALTEDRTIIVRVGITASLEEGMDWKFLQGFGPSLLVSCFDIGDRETAWIVDIVGRLWFTTGVTQDRPEGSGMWWQVSMSEYLMQDSSAVDTLKSLMKTPQNLTKLLSGEKGAGLISVGGNGIWVCPGFRDKLHVCRGSVIGHRWDIVLPAGMVPSTKWLQVGAQAVSGDSGYVWTQQPSLGLFSFSSKWRGAKVTEIAPPSITHQCTALSVTPSAMWVLLSTGRVYIRAGMGSHLAHGLQWTELDLTQLGNTKFAHLSCGSENVWGVDNKGNVFFRIGVDAPSPGHLNPAWVPVPGGPVGAGSYFVKVSAGPNDWMVWAIDNKNLIYVRKGITECMPIGTHWAHVQGTFAVSLAVGEKMVYALNAVGEILVRYGTSQNNMAGDFWKKIPGAMEQISATQDDDLWGIDKDGQLFKRVTYYHERSESLQELDRVLSPGGTVEEGDWELL